MDKNYTYYTASNIGAVPVYLCIGTKEERSAFKQDVEAIGLVVEDTAAACLAADPVSNGAHNDCLQGVADLIAGASGKIPIILLRNK